MSRTNKSLIKNKSYIKQVLCFDGLKHSSVYPSDIDAIIELNNEHLILFEVKFNEGAIPTGQRLMLERIIDSWQSKITTGCVVYATHNTPSSDNILLADCDVRKIYYLGNWVDVEDLKVGDFLNQYYKKHKIYEQN